MGHYKSNLRDIEFNLFEVLRRQDVLGAEPYPDLDEDTARGILDEVNRLATGPLAESFAEADRNPPVFDPATGSVRMPEGFKRSYQAFVDAEWFRLELPPELGGSRAPRSLGWSVAELILGANPAVWMYSSGPVFAQLLWRLGTPEQKRFAERAIERGWTADHGADRTGRRIRRRRGPHQGGASSPTARGISRVSSGSSPAPSTTWRKTSSTSCSPVPRGTAPAPRDCRCSWCPSTWPTPTATSVSGTASRSRTSSTRWA